MLSSIVVVDDRDTLNQNNESKKVTMISSLVVPMKALQQDYWTRL